MKCPTCGKDAEDQEYEARCEEIAQLEADLLSARADVERLRDVIKTLLYLFDRGLPGRSIGRRRCDEARAAIARSEEGR